MIRRGVAVLLGVCCGLTAGAAWPQDPACDELRHHSQLGGESLTWTKLKSGDRLEAGDAILTCEDSEVLVCSSARFGHYVTWETQGPSFVGTVPARVFVVVHPRDEVVSPVEVLSVVGVAYQSTDREAIRKARVVDGRSWSENDPYGVEMRRKDAERYRDLTALAWVPLGVGDVLGSWEMLWVQPGGRVEIEVLPHGGPVDGDHDVTDAWGRPIGKKRFQSSQFWLLHPDDFDTARATRVIGEVWRTTEADRVREFFARHLEFYGGSRDPVAEQAERDERDLWLRDADGAEKWWAEFVARKKEERRRWLDSLKGGDLE